MSILPDSPPRLSAYLRDGDTPDRLAAGFGIGVTTAWRHVRESAAWTVPDQRRDVPLSAASG